MLTWQLQRVRELSWEKLIHYIPAELEEKAYSDFWGSAKIPCPTLTHYFSGHYEEGAHWRTKKLRNLKAISPYLCWTVCPTLTNMASATPAWAPILLSLVFTSFASYFICIKYKRQPWNHPAVLSLWTDQFLQEWKAKSYGMELEEDRKQ